MKTAALLSLILACAGTAPSRQVPPPPPGDPLRIVMLGNSLTYFNDMPAMVAELAMSGGATRPEVVTVASPNWGLADHLGSTTSMAAITQHKVDVVTMQQGPSTLPESGLDLTRSGKLLADKVIAAGGRPGMYVVWPPRGGNIDAGIANHTAAAEAAEMAIYPVAQAFRLLGSSHPEIALLGNDNFHPSAAGSWLAAMVITAVIFDQDPLRYPNPRSGAFPAAWEDPIRQAAKDAVIQFGRR
ncbi:MAG TPA: hypothetical protein PLL69_03990 [Gemmatimonadales bacterium]|nr:hypothetical protein [Gemmatimonadales bacterium]